MPLTSLTDTAAEIRNPKADASCVFISCEGSKHSDGCKSDSQHKVNSCLIMI